MSLLLRYGLVGVLTNLVMYGSYLGLTLFGIEPKVAMTATYLVGASIGFACNRKWIFSHNGNVSGAAMRFIAAHVCGFLLSYLILLVFVDKLACPHQLVQVASIMFVAGFLFLLFKFWVFRNSEVIRQ